jgi:hypothetical protein
MEPEKDIFEQWKEERENRSWIKKRYDNISLWWRNDGKYIHREFIRGVKKLWYWLPIIWKDRDWDSHYIFEVLKHKLKAQAKYIGERDIHTRAQQDARRMRLCVSLMEKVQGETYAMEYMEYFDDINWFEPIEDSPKHSSWESKIIVDNSETYFEKYPLIYRRVLKGEGYFKIDYDFRKPGGVPPEINQKIAMNIAHINQDRAHKLLFKIMEENILGWWD